MEPKLKGKDLERHKNKRIKEPPHHALLCCRPYMSALFVVEMENAAPRPVFEGLI